ncbi:MAG: GTP-binding protein, partial [Candidatus Lokiarchaeota archaeon]|nr:GTP-binding protein [Candidatus Lokiarchaeota archaeon]MBD3342587.1 GTP-binding protein [Candidatus Lokiarchaeota archaeon]
MVKKAKFVWKLLILGDTAVGKTSLLNQYVSHSFKEDYKATLGVNIIIKNVEMEEIDGIVRLILWDIAGQDRYEKSRKAYYEGCSGVFFVYDITRYSSFENIEIKWLEDLRGYLRKEDCPYILVGNKSDLEKQRGVFKENGARLAEKINAIDFI